MSKIMGFVIVGVVALVAVALYNRFSGKSIATLGANAGK